MERFINFFIEVGKLKTIQRRGWLLREIKNPESVADHAFRVLLLAWIFGKERNINIKRLLKLALVHSLSAVYIDYISPYDKLLEIKGRKEIIKKYPALALRAPIDQKGKIAKQRLEEEKKAIKKLTKDLPEPINHEINYLWLDFQERGSREAKFLRALDKIENLIQAYEYKDKVKEDILTPFLVQIKEFTYDKQLLKFVESLQMYIKNGKGAVKNKKDRNIIEFLLEVGKLKEVKRKGWVIRGVKEPESVASHCYRTSIMTWCFAGRRRLDQEAAIIMSIIHDLYVVVLGDVTPYDETINKVTDKKKFFERLPWSGVQKEKEVIAVARLRKEVAALDKIIHLLPHDLRHELKYLWLEYKTGASKEARFTRQIDRIEDVIQAMQYHKDDKSVPIKAFWLEMKELIDDPLLVDFVEQLDHHFLRQGKDN